MSDVIKRIERFSFYNNYAIVSHLENMALLGYRLINIDRSIWTYKIVKPSPIKYRITYFKDPSLIFYKNPYIKRTEQEFFDYCRNVGWILSGEWGQMQIFSTATHEHREIETDYASEFIAIKSIVKSKSLPSTMAMSFLAVCQGFIQLVQYVNYPVDKVSSPTFILLSFIWLILFLAGAIGTQGYFVWKKKATISINKYNKYPEDTDTRFRLAVGLLGFDLIIFVAQTLMLAFNFSSSLAFFYTAQIIVAVILVRRARFRQAEKNENNNILLIDNKVSNDTVVSSNTTVSNNTDISGDTTVLNDDKSTSDDILSSDNVISNDRKILKRAVLTLTVTLILTFIVNSIINNDNTEPKTHTIAITGGTLTYNLTNDNIPLKVQDLYNTDYMFYSYELDVQESIFAKYSRISQYSFDIDAPEFSYEIVTFKNKMFYNTCLDYYISPYILNYNTMFDVHLTNDPVWDANRVYQVFDNAIPIGIYIICYDDKIIYYNGFDTLNSQEAEIVYEKLHNYE